MPSRRSLRIVAGALVLATPLLTSCGFGKATDQVYTPAAGVNDRSGAVKVLSAVVVAAQPNSGTFLASFSNNGSDPVSLESIDSAGEPEVSVADLPTGELDPRGFVNLADEGGPVVTGSFDAGQTIPMTITFSSGESATLDVPVVFACDEWSGLDTSTAVEALDEDGEVDPTADASADPSSTASADATAPEPGEPYDCEAVLDDEGVSE